MSVCFTFPLCFVHRVVHSHRSRVMWPFVLHFVVGIHMAKFGHASSLVMSRSFTAMSVVFLLTHHRHECLTQLPCVCSMCVASFVCERNSNKTVWSCICSWCVLFNHVCTSQSTIMFGLPYLSSKCVSASMCTSHVCPKAHRPICNTIVVVARFLSNIHTCFHAEMWHYRIQELDLWQFSQL